MTKKEVLKENFFLLLQNHLNFWLNLKLLNDLENIFIELFEAKII
jgi:hypothetical protein